MFSPGQNESLLSLSSLQSWSISGDQTNSSVVWPTLRSHHIRFIRSTNGAITLVRYWDRWGPRSIIKIFHDKMGCIAGHKVWGRCMVLTTVAVTLSTVNVSNWNTQMVMEIHAANKIEIDKSSILKKFNFISNVSNLTHWVLAKELYGIYLFS